MMLTMRYGMAQKSSSDTGMRVKDTAQKLVQQGKFMGGKAPYGYQLEFSGEFSKHQRALKHLVIVPEQAQVVRYIYELSFHKEFGSGKIAGTLNADSRYRQLAPNDVWKSETITSILTNPVYAGYTAYKRREKSNGSYHCLNSRDWILAEKPNEKITIIDVELWEKVQRKRERRREKYVKNPENEKNSVISRNDGMLALIDVAHCGYCGWKLTNGTKYDYWTIKRTGEKKCSRKPIYKCQAMGQGVPHPPMKQIRADQVEPIVFQVLAEYVGKLQENETVFEQILKNQKLETYTLEQNISREQKILEVILEKISILEDKIPEAITGNYPLSLEDLVQNIKRQKEKAQKQKKGIKDLEMKWNRASVSAQDWETFRRKIPSWQDIFLNADAFTKRVLVDKLIERIDITDEEVKIRFKIDLDGFLNQTGMNIYDGRTPCRPGSW